MRARLASFLFFFCVASGLSATPYCEVKRYFAEDGLPQNRITRIIQDKKGLIWLATWNGLVQFDGYEFTNYNLKDDEQVMGNSRLNGLFLNSRGDFWCVNNNNEVFLFDVAKKTLINFMQLADLQNDVTATIQIFPLEK